MDAQWASATAAALAHSEGIPWAPWAVVSGHSCLLEFPIVGSGGAGRAADAAGESEISKFWNGPSSRSPGCSGLRLQLR